MKKRIAALLTAISLMFSATGCTQKQPEKKYTTTSIEDTKDESTKPNSHKEIYNEYYNYFENYNNDNIGSYLSNEEINQMINNNYDTTICNFNSNIYIEDEQYNIDVITNVIKENSNNYIEKNKQFGNLFFQLTKSFSNKTWESCILRFDASFNITLKKIIDNTNNDIEEDLCNISQLICVSADEDTYSKYINNKNKEIDNYGIYLPEENLIIINSTALTELHHNEDIAEFNKIIGSVIYHLLNHVRQRNCNCRIENSNKYYPFNYNGIIDNTTIYESSAESSYYNQYNGRITHKDNFSEEQSDEQLLFLLSIFTDSNINEYYNAIYDGDINKLHQFFGLKTQEEIYDFHQLVYIIDAKNNKLSETVDKDLTTIYRENILGLTLKNMVDYTHNNKDFKIEENISFLSLINYIINSNNINNNNNINNIYTLNNQYITFLQNHYNISEDFMNYYLSDYYINKIIEEVTYGSNKVNIDKEQILPVLLNRFPKLRYVLNINLDNSKTMNELIKTK